MPLQARLGLLVAIFVWAISYIAVKVALTAAPPLTVAGLRLIISALCFVAWYALRRQWPKIPNRKLFTALFGLSLLGTGLHYGIQTIGLQYTTAANASIYATTGPIAIALLAIFMGERLTLRKGGGILLALCGVLLVQGLETLTKFELSGHMLGDALVFISVFMWGVFTVFGKRVADEVGPLPMIGLTTIIGAIWMIPISGVEIYTRSFDLASISPKAWLAITFLGITCSFLAPLLYFIALKHTEAQKVGVYLYAIPPLTYIMAALFLGETIGINLILGALLVLAGVYITDRA
ncbi:MAG: DMT family transporter [Candidatus Aminicenantes bacterium]|nr:DMT family transporter [Candidatus Aminicenantes bacterium]